ncbi:hypothetical protein GYMLUDRAFT_49129 [Collybiopsis luxurians FD-317 M1]|uniref:Acetyl-CoA hydrolase/transferase C-terminal domain-containing protein n=1 Tax=Collybiopsis luxurians FD-317 M1 TaxID=944289 RepID=A0A0D0C7B1_9AGAR|nr:hypothetical protein GYMLUDRAFT_49129 [Collybiopsis luxurians FD-317 M1]
MNTPLEVDIYGHANSTNALGKNDPTGISCIVPFASHVDQTEHDLDVVVTDQGLADICGLSPRKRAKYYDRALHECMKRGAGHEPHMLRVRVAMP